MAQRKGPDMQHLCDKNPKGKDWYEGPVKDCPYHTDGPRTLTKLPKVKESARQRRRKDASAGVVGHDSGSGFYRDGPHA